MAAVGAVPTVTALTLSSRSKASPFRMILALLGHSRAWNYRPRGLIHQSSRTEVPMASSSPYLMIES